MDPGSKSLPLRLSDGSVRGINLESARSEPRKPSSISSTMEEKMPPVSYSHRGDSRRIIIKNDSPNASITS